jgi:HD-GYP domain-containing protein (c-di-GMP phosphodiesterase class II)
LAKKLGLPPGTIEGVYVAGTIHDLGKISVPAEILSKPSTLTATEFSLIKTHPDVGYEILKPIQFPWPIAEMVRQHHERMDGSGYPRGLKGDEILLEARILAVADVVEAISSHRPYRPALGLERAMEELKKGKGTLYDPQVVDACLELLAREVRDLSLLDQIS